MKHNVLVTWYGKTQGGAEESVIDLCNKISESGRFGVVLLFVNSPKFYPDLSRVNPDVIVYNIRLSLWFYEAVSFFLVVYIFLKRKITILHSSYRGIVGESLAGKVFRKTVLATIRAIPLEISNAKKFKRVDILVAISKSVEERLRVLGYDRTIKVIYNGINLNNFDCSVNQSPDAKNRFYFMARLVRWKRPDWFIFSAVQLHKKFPKTTFHIFGNGPERENLKKMITQNNAAGFIKMHGWVSANEVILGEMGICVMASYLEPFGKTTVEAVFRNKVVVGTKSGATPELLPDYDLLFEMDDMSNLLAKMDEAYQRYEYYFKDIAQHRNKFIEYYNMERVANDYLQLYDKAIH